MTTDSARDRDGRDNCTDRADRADRDNCADRADRDGRDNCADRDGRDGRHGGTRPTGAVRVLTMFGHRWPTLLALALAIATFVDGVPPLGILAGLLIIMPLCYVLFGSLRGELRRPGVLTVQIAGCVGFGVVALIALAVDETLGRHLLAAGWLGHAVWDFVHHRTGRVVPRAWSEWCCVVDASGALAMVLLA